MLSQLATEVASFCRRFDLLDADNIIVGLSGGPDSVCLISVLAELARESEVFPKLYAFHLNHGLRGAEADRDEKIAEDISRRLSVPFRAAHEDIRAKARQLGRGEEETGRIVRYELMRQYAASLSGRTVIAVAHHRGDLAETFMMNVFRGAGLEGLVSPRAKSEDIIRPLLSSSKDELTAYLDERGIPYGTDSTNGDNSYTRNRWRNEIFPKIASVSVKEPQSAIEDTVALLSDDLSYIESEVTSRYEDYIVRTGGFLFLPVRELSSWHPALAKRVIRSLWRETFGNLTDFASVHTDKVFGACAEGAKVMLDMPFDRKALIESEMLFFTASGKQEEACAALARHRGLVISKAGLCLKIDPFTEKNTVLPQTDIQISTEIIENIDALRYNTKSWFVPVYGDGCSLELRNGAGSLYCRKAGSSAGKQLRRFLSDCKVPSSVRDMVVVVASDDKVLWIPGLGHMEGFLSESSRMAHLADIADKPVHYLKITIDTANRNER